MDRIGDAPLRAMMTLEPWLLTPHGLQVLSGFSDEPICLLPAHSSVIGEAERMGNGRVIEAAGNAARACFEAGFDPVECLRALPDLVKRHGLTG